MSSVTLKFPLLMKGIHLHWEGGENNAPLYVLLLEQGSSDIYKLYTECNLIVARFFVFPTWNDRIAHSLLCHIVQVIAVYNVSECVTFLWLLTSGMIVLSVAKDDLIFNGYTSSLNMVKLVVELIVRSTIIRQFNTPGFQ